MNISLKKIGLGAAHWGSEYGSVKKSTKISQLKIKQILNFAKSKDICLIDTAHSYNGSEKVIGENIQTKQFSIVTKTIPFMEKNDLKTELHYIKNAFNKSLSNLNRKNIYGLLVHNSKDLLGPKGSFVWDELSKLKELKLVQKIGVSVYDVKELEEITKKYVIDIIQIPFNVFNQSFKINGCIKHLKSINVEIHARSIFLQGLIGMNVNAIPHEFSELKSHILNWCNELKSLNLNPIEAALKYALQENDINKLIIGFNDVSEIKNISKFSNNPFYNQKYDFTSFHIKKINLVDPRKWKSNY